MAKPCHLKGLCWASNWRSLQNCSIFKQVYSTRVHPMKRILATSIASATLFAFAPSALADFSAEVGIYSDYRDKGISWTDDKPALQAEIEYSHDTGIYLGAWASNVDYGEGEDA